LAGICERILDFGATVLIERENRMDDQIAFLPIAVLVPESSR
jgi:hypothetical protein